MASVVARLAKNGLIKPPEFVKSNTCYETLMGSEAYGIASNTSDIDVYGFCLPSLEEIFPHTAGYIPGFGTQKKPFEQFQQHHIKDTNSKEYDIVIYSIVKYFDLCMENNPNMVDSLFTPRRCVFTSTAIGEMVRERRKIFLHKGAHKKFKGYAYSQMDKIKKNTASKNPKRAESIERFGYDVKYAVHLIRLICEGEMILREGDLDITTNRELLKGIRRGEWSLERIENYFQEKERDLDNALSQSTLPNDPNEGAIKQLLIDCLEHHYGSIGSLVRKPDNTNQALNEIRAVLNRYGVN